MLISQIWDWLFKSYEVNGRILLRDGLITLDDVGECILKGDCKKLGIKLPAWSILHCLLASAKANSSGLAICMSLKLCYYLHIGIERSNHHHLLEFSS